MKNLFLVGCAAVTIFVLAGCEEKTPEQIEADKYPPARKLTPEEQKKVQELSQTRPPSTTQSQ